MKNYEETFWFSQTMLTHKDRIYGTDGYLRITINTSTTDYTQFYPPTFNISISNNLQKTCSLGLTDVSDLLRSFEMLIKQPDANGSEIYKKYKDVEFYFKCFIEEKQKERLILIQLTNSETDFTKIILPLQVFLGIKYLLENFKNNYFNICKDLLFQNIQSETQKIIKTLPSLIKGISSQIIPNQIVSKNIILDNSVPEIDHSIISNTEATINDLDRFLGVDMGNIKIPDLEEIKEIKDISVEIKSKFVENVLKNNLYTLENMLSGYMLDNKPIDLFKNEVINLMRADENFTMLSDISEDDKKSLYYITTMFFKNSYEEYIENNKSLPDSIPVFKYNLTKMDDENIQIAYDLFLFNIYIRTLRRRLEGKSSDANLNKSLFHLQLRCFTDVFVFPYLDKLNHDSKTLASIILNRYKYYDSKGVFDKYKVILNDYNCTVVGEADITSASIEATEKIIGSKTDTINKFHEKLYKLEWTKVPTKCSFNLEQILNECLPLELANKMGKDLNDDVVVMKIRKKYKVSDDIVKFISKGKNKITVTKEESISNIERLCKHFANEIPSNEKELFLTEIKNYKDKKFDMKTTSFNLIEYGENIIKALYLWDSENATMKNNYKEFYAMVDNEVMNKDLILAKIKSDFDVNSNSNSEWNFGV